ncbi:AFUA_2G17970 family ergot alkaloid biosynthesis protein [Colletotrichum acutatum]
MKEPQRRLRYNVAISLDGFIAPPDGSTDWIVQDDNIDFQALYAQFDTFVMGRKTYQCMFAMGEQNPLRKYPKQTLVVVSRTLSSDDHPGVTIVSHNFTGYVADLKNAEGRDIWLMGGGQLAGPCLDAGILDSVETAIMPVMLRKGTRMLPDSALTPLGGFKLELVDCKNSLGFAAWRWGGRILLLPKLVTSTSQVTQTCSGSTHGVNHTPQRICSSRPTLIITQNFPLLSNLATRTTQKILILGGTGKVGRQITKLFARTSTPVYQSSRSGASTTEPDADNIHAVAFDWETEQTWATVLGLGAASIFLVAPPVMDMLPPMRSFIDQARIQSRTTRFVLLSGSPVEPDINGYAMGRPHAYLKELGDRGECEATIINESTVYSATADGKIPWVATEDIAACAFQLLTQEDAPNDEYLILGPELLTYDEVAGILSDVLGRKIVHKRLSAQELVDRYAAQGMPRDYAEMMGGLDTAIKNGSENRTNSVVLAVTGKQPKKFRDFAERNKVVWAQDA